MVCFGPMPTTHDSRYQELIRLLRELREQAGLSQKQLAEKLGVGSQSFIAKIEGGERRVDVIELLDIAAALNVDISAIAEKLGWTNPARSGDLVAVPPPGEVEKHRHGIQIPMLWRGKRLPVVVEKATPAGYLAAEKAISNRFQSLNHSSERNRDAIAWAMQEALRYLPGVNPSDIYHHIVYRIYMREYKRSDANQSWVRAGGEALEVFIEQTYNPLLEQHGIRLQALISGAEKKKAIKAIGLSGKVGDAKLDVALLGQHQDKWHIFGGLHVKASLAERVSDDVPCSVEMMKNGYWSGLFTFDAKSFPPPVGDLVNRGELGTEARPSDKRKYITQHGSFSCCVCYNTRIEPSPVRTASGKRIFVCGIADSTDALPGLVVAAWKDFRRLRLR
jgi:transcriptional regulator with XRE-family HTH domain